MVAALFVLILAAAHVLLPRFIPLGEPGSKDFIQYWSAYQIARNGGNPYEPSEMKAVQIAVGEKTDRPIMYWSPPWFLPLAGPVLDLDYELSAAMWMRISLALYLTALWLVAVGTPGGITCGGLVAALLFAPLFDCLQWGQSSTILALIIAAIWSCTRSVSRQAVRAFLIGLLLPWLTLKPHLFFVCGGYLLTRWRTVSTRVAPLACGVLVTALLFWGVLNLLPEASGSGWGRSLLMAERGDYSTHEVDARTNWVTATYAGISRIALATIVPSQNPPSTAPLMIFPLIGILLLFATRRTVAPWRGGDWLLVLSCSLLFAPYGWHYDAVILGPMLYLAYAETENVTCRLALLTSAILGKILMPAMTSQHQFVGSISLLLFAALYCIRSAQKDAPPLASKPSPY